MKTKMKKTLKKIGLHAEHAIVGTSLFMAGFVAGDMKKAIDDNNTVRAVIDAFVMSAEIAGASLLLYEDVRVESDLIDKEVLV